jgi:hypothetical protein
MEPRLIGNLDLKASQAQRYTLHASCGSDLA